MLDHSGISLGCIWDHIVISLPRRFITIKTFSLPAPNRKSVDSIIEFELERHFATGTEDLYYAFQAKEKTDNQFLIVLFSIKKAIADYYFNLFLRIDLKPTVIEISRVAKRRSNRGDGSSPGGSGDSDRRRYTR